VEEAMEATQSHLDQILDEIASLSLDEQEMLVDILKKRNIEQKRLRVAREVKEAQREHQKGLTKRGTIEDLIKDLESD
jgi:CHASE3 domain sensor protein